MPTTNHVCKTCNEVHQVFWSDDLGEQEEVIECYCDTRITVVLTVTETQLPPDTAEIKYRDWQYDRREK